MLPFCKYTSSFPRFFSNALKKTTTQRTRSQMQITQLFPHSRQPLLTNYRMNFATSGGKSFRFSKFTAVNIVSCVIGGGVLAYCTTNSTPKISKVGNEITFPRDVDDSGMRAMIRYAVKEGDAEVIEQLILLLRNNYNSEKSFPNINDWYLWEIDIRDALINKRDLSLIKKIFPQFSPQTLSYVEVFYKPIEHGDKELVQALVEGGMQLHSKANKLDPLLYALYFKKLEIANYLLSQRSYNINTAYPFCVSPIRKNFIYAQDWITPAYLAVIRNDPETLQFLINLGAVCSQPNKRPKNADKYRMSDDDASNPLIYSIVKGRKACFEIILKTKNIDLNYRGNHERTALVQAIVSKQFTQAHALITAGADVNLGDTFNVNALIMAVRFGEVSLVKALLVAGANPNYISSSKANLWHEVARSPNSKEICDILMTTGIQNTINDENDDGEMPLVEAIDGHNPEGVFALLRSGANANKDIENLDNDTREKLKLPQGAISLQQYAEATLQSLKEGRAKYPYDKYDYERYIAYTKKILVILNKPPKAIHVEVLSNAKYKPEPLFGIIPEFNKEKLFLGSQEGLEAKIHKAAPFCDGNFVREFARKQAGEVFTPPELIQKLSAEMSFYQFVSQNKATRAMLQMAAPQMLCAFSDDPKMKHHLQAMWNLFQDDPQEFHHLVKKNQ